MKKLVFLIILNTLLIRYPSQSAIALESDYVNSQNLAQLKENRYLIRNEDNSEENLTKFLILMGMVLGITIISGQLSRQRRLAKGSALFSKNSQRDLIDRVSPRLRRQLLRLINDPKTVNRLLMGVHQHNRDRDPDWLAEKVIYDLKRGR